MRNRKRELGISPVEVYSDTANDLLDRFVGAAGKVEEILDSTCEPGLYATELERRRLGLLHLWQVQFKEVLRIAHTRSEEPVSGTPC